MKVLIKFRPLSKTNHTLTWFWSIKPFVCKLLKQGPLTPLRDGGNQFEAFKVQRSHTLSIHLLICGIHQYIGVLAKGRKKKEGSFALSLPPFFIFNSLISYTRHFSKLCVLAWELCACKDVRVCVSQKKTPNVAHQSAETQLSIFVSVDARLTVKLWQHKIRG